MLLISNDYYHGYMYNANSVGNRKLNIDKECFCMFYQFLYFHFLICIKRICHFIASVNICVINLYQIIGWFMWIMHVYESCMNVALCILWNIIIVWPNIKLQSNAVITRSNIVTYYINNFRNWGWISIRCRIHKRHPIPRPNGQTMGHLLWIFVRKLTVL